jgi:WD40 repeat protein
MGYIDWRNQIGIERSRARGRMRSVCASRGVPYDQGAHRSDSESMSVGREVCRCGSWSDAYENTGGDSRSKSPGAFVATGSRDKSIRLWDAQTSQCLRTFVCNFSPDYCKTPLTGCRSAMTTGFAHSYFTLQANTSSRRQTTRRSKSGTSKQGVVQRQ